MNCEAGDRDCLSNSSYQLSGLVPLSNVSDVDEVWHIINLSTSVIMFLFSITANASLIFALNKARKQTFTATSVAWISKADTCRMVIVYMSCIPSAIAEEWLYGDALCKIMGYITTSITIGQNIILLFMSIIRYLAVAKPCLGRESTLYRAATVVVLFAVVSSVPCGAMPFLASPNFEYIPVLHRCAMYTDWASKTTSILFSVIPTLFTLTLAVVTLRKIYMNKWAATGAQNIGLKRRLGNVTRPAIQEVRASVGIATVLTVSSVMILLNVLASELSSFCPSLTQMVLLLLSSVLFQVGPIVRSILFITTSPVLRQVIIGTIFSTSHQETSVSLPSKFRMIQGEMPAPKPVYSREHRVTIHVEPHSHNEEGSTVVRQLRRLSNVSTLTCEVLCDGEKEACTISVSGDRGDFEDKEGSGSTDSVLVCIGSTFNGKMTSSSCSLSESSRETIVSSSLQHAGSYSRPKNRTSRAHRTSAASLSPLDVRYISQMDMSFDMKNKFPNATVSVTKTPRKIPTSFPIILRGENSDIPAAKLAFYSDNEKSPNLSKTSLIEDVENSLGI